MRILAKEIVDKVGQSVLLQGWVNSRRDHGKITFIDLRDRSGLVQLVLNKALGDARPEDVISVTGTVRERPASMVNPKIPTGSVEVEVKELTVLSRSKELPLPIDTDGYDINEEVRLKYRYLDLRRERMQRNIRLRSRFVDLVRQHLFKNDFVEIETPILTKSTPEGSRDFLVPSRLSPGKFYALPQSPQQYKQLLMVAGFERYFQIARCLRDEDPRADRGFEHTQVDIEMSFVTREDVMATDEELMIAVMEEMGYRIQKKPFPVVTYKEALRKFGSDKFDLRTDREKKDGVLAFAWVVDFPFFEKVKESGSTTGNLSGGGPALSDPEYRRGGVEGWTFTHNPFSAPKNEHEAWLLKKERIGDILTSQYDLVFNGYEVGGGSIRSHKPDVLLAVFEVMGYTPSEVKQQFGHMLEAFTYGVPPHGGLAHGVERLLMTVTNEPYLREVVAFPMTAGGRTSVMDAPNVVSQEQLDELGLSVQNPPRGSESVFDAIVGLFKKKKLPYDVLEHEPVYTSADAAAIRGTELEEGVKAILLIADTKPVMVSVAGNTKIDVKALKGLYGFRDVRMATPEEVIEVTGVPIGAVPPFGALFDIPLYVDEEVRTHASVVFNAGLHTKSLRVSAADYENVATPIVGAFSRKT
jgi:aspartyl-tRNA synthetase